MASKNKHLDDVELIRAVYTGYDVALSLYDYDLIRKANSLATDIDKLSIVALNLMSPADLKTVSQLFFLGRHIHMKAGGFPKSVVALSELVSSYCFMAGAYGAVTPSLAQADISAPAFGLN
jgi:hypothetical protein